MLLRTCATALAALFISASVAAAQVAIEAPSEAQRAQARELYASVVAIDSSTGPQNVVLANLLAERFRAGGFAADDVTIVPAGETAGLVVRYRGNGTGGPADPFSRAHGRGAGAAQRLGARSVHARRRKRLLLWSRFVRQQSRPHATRLTLPYAPRRRLHVDARSHHLVLGRRRKRRASAPRHCSRNIARCCTTPNSR